VRSPSSRSYVRTPSVVASTGDSRSVHCQWSARSCWKSAPAAGTACARSVVDGASVTSSASSGGRTCTAPLPSRPAEAHARVERRKPSPRWPRHPAYDACGRRGAGRVAAATVETGGRRRGRRGDTPSGRTPDVARGRGVTRPWRRSCTRRRSASRSTAARRSRASRAGPPGIRGPGGRRDGAATLLAHAFTLIGTT
jgi:hypothetical protein